MMLLRLLIGLGFGVGALGVMIGIALDQRSSGFVLFATGFLLVLLGISGSFLHMPRSGKGAVIAGGLRLAAIGFVIAVFGGVLGFSMSKDGLSDVFFYIGFGFALLGIFSGIIGIMKSSR